MLMPATTEIAAAHAGERAVQSGDERHRGRPALCPLSSLLLQPPFPPALSPNHFSCHVI